MRSLSRVRCAKRRVRFLLSSSAQTFFSPARCVSARRTLLRADHSATVLRKPLRSSEVVKRRLMPDSAAVLSEAEGRTKRKCFVRTRETAVIARASCAMVSKHAMYAWACAFVVRCGERCLTSPPGTRKRLASPSRRTFAASHHRKAATRHVAHCWSSASRSGFPENILQGRRSPHPSFACASVGSLSRPIRAGNPPSQREPLCSSLAVLTLLS